MNKFIMAIIFFVITMISYAEDKTAAEKYEDEIVSKMMQRLVPNTSDSKIKITEIEDVKLEYPKEECYPNYIPITWNVENHDKSLSFTLFIQKQIDVEIINGDVTVTFGNGFSSDKLGLSFNLKL